jgi:flavin-binding protein dodecin
VLEALVQACHQSIHRLGLVTGHLKIGDYLKLRHNNSIASEGTGYNVVLTMRSLFNRLKRRWQLRKLGYLPRMKEDNMSDSVYKVITLVGTSPKSWEEAATAAVEIAAKTLRDLRIAEVEELDMQIDKGKVINYRARVKVSFKYEG